MQLTTNQITSLSRAKLLEETNEIISDATILIYANLTYQDIIKRVFTSNKVLSATIAFTSGVGTLPALFGTLYGSAKDSSDNIFEEVSIEDFDNETLSRMITLEGGEIKSFPTSTASLEIKYYPTYANLTTTQDPEIDEYFHECIVYGIIARAYEDLQDQELADKYFAKYENYMVKKQSVQSNYEEGNQRGGQMFTYTRLL